LKEKNLGHTHAGEWIHAPVVNFIVTVAKTENIILLRVEIKRHNMGASPRIDIQTIAWLQHETK